MRTPHLVGAAARAEHAQRRGQALFDSPAVGMAEHDLSGRWLAANDRLCALSGQSRAELMATNPLSLLHPEDVPALVQQLRRLVRGQLSSVRCEPRCRRADGRQAWVVCTTTAVRNAQGRVVSVLSVIEDISERHAVQEALRAGERMYRSVVDALGEGVLVLDRQGRVLGTNPAARAILGAEDLWTRPPAQWGLHWPDGGPVPADALAIHRCLHSGQRQEGQVLRLPRPGGDRWLLLACAPMRSGAEPNGLAELVELVEGRAAAPVTDADADRAPGVVLSMTDITERYQTEQQLRQLSLALEQSPAAVVIMDLEGRIEYVNAAHARISGWAPEEVLGANPRLDEVAGTDPALHQRLAALGRSGESWHGELVALRKNGERYPERLSVVPMRRPDGRLTHYLAVMEDVSETKRIEGELRRHHHQLEDLVAERTQALQEAMRARETSERFLRSVADNLPDMVAYWDDARVCRFANRAYQQWFGDGDGPTVGSHRHSLLRHLRQGADDSEFTLAMAGQARHFEARLQHADGSSKHVLVHYTPDWRGQKVVGVLVLVADVSAVKQAEWRLQALNEQLRQARDKAEQASRAKSAFLANMSHEIRTPMNAIIGLTHLMRREQHQPATLDRMDKIAQAAHHLLDVINDVLDLSKIESGKLELEHTDFPLDAVLARVRALVADNASAKGLVLGVERAPEVPARLYGDPTRLSQALLNLVGNAVKFTDHGRVLLRCELAPAPEPDQAPTTGAGSEDGGLLLRFTVEDTGIGVAPERLRALFEPFEQGDTSITRRHGGTGLGLAITHRLAELMGGTVGATSAPGQGSRFWFTARLQASDAAVLWQEVPALSGTLPPRLPLADLERRLREEHAHAQVLVVEDNPINQEVATALLRGLGFEVDCADDGLQAVERASQRSYDLILMDMQMPRMDGLAASRRIRGLAAHVRTPIVAMTANAFGDDRRACLEAGMDDHLAKPVDPALMYAMLAFWLGESRTGAVRPPAERSAAAPGAAAPGPSVASPSPGQPAGSSPAPAPAPLPAPVAALSPAVPAEGPLAGLDEIDTSRALLFLPGREAVFFNAVRQFALAYGDGPATLVQAQQAHDWPSVGRQLHSLRGACGAVGAVGLAQQIQALEASVAALDPGHEPPATWAVDWARLQQRLGGFCQQVLARLQPAAAAAQ